MPQTPNTNFSKEQASVAQAGASVVRDQSQHMSVGLQNQWRPLRPLGVWWMVIYMWHMS